MPPLGAFKVVKVSGCIPHLKHVNVCSILFPCPGALLTMWMIHTNNCTTSFCLVFNAQKVLVGYAGIVILLVDNVLNTPHITMATLFCELGTIYKCESLYLRQNLAINIVVGNHKEIKLVFLCFFNKLIKGKTAVRCNCVTMRHANIPFVTIVIHNIAPLEWVKYIFSINIIFRFVNCP